MARRSTGSATRKPKPYVAGGSQLIAKCNWISDLRIVIASRDRLQYHEVYGQEFIGRGGVCLIKRSCRLFSTFYCIVTFLAYPVHGPL